MGKGTITGGGGQGQYTVTIDYGSELADARIDTLTNRNAVLDQEIAALEQEVSSLQSGAAAALNKLDAAIATYNASEKTPADREKLEDDTNAPLLADAKLKTATNSLAILKMEKSNIEANLREFEGLQMTVTRDMWCADYTEDGAGVVSTIEINAEQPVAVIAPDAPAYTTDYGEMTAREVQTAEQVYLNAALLPGWQKFMPTYRSGTISALDYAGDTCDVDLDAAESSAQSLPINQASSLSGIPVEYMTCNASAFELGDKVVVQFSGQDWSNPKVIGFVSHPRPCGSDEVWFLIEVASTSVYSGAPIGGKFRGIPTTSSSSNPSPGLYVVQGTVGGDYSSQTNPGQTGQYDPGEGSWNQGTLRIRFDTLWKKEFDKDTNFIPWAYAVTSHGPHEDLAPNLSGLPEGGGIEVIPFTYATMKKSERWGARASSGMAPWYDGSHGGDLTDDPLSPIWYGTMPATEEYNFRGYTGNAWNGLQVTSNDLFHADSWLRQFYTPPQTITMIIEGVEFYFHYVRMGGTPKCTDSDREVHVASPPSEGATAPYFTNGEDRMCALYRKGDPV